MQIPLINGRRYSYASIELSLTRGANKTEIFVDISEINYADNLEVGDVEGTSRMFVGHTSGVYRPENTTFNIAKSSGQKFIAAIGPGWLGSNVSLTAKYADHGEPLIVDVITGMIIGISDGHSSGPDGLQQTVTLKTFKIIRNGLDPLGGNGGIGGIVSALL